jgi:NADH:ubiquinone oxidoreductase subunit 6 (subunit J)
MVLVVFVIMLLNIEQEERRRTRLRFLVPTAIGLSAVLIAESLSYWSPCRSFELTRLQPHRMLG